MTVRSCTLTYYLPAIWFVIEFKLPWTFNVRRLTWSKNNLFKLVFDCAALRIICVLITFGSKYISCILRRWPTDLLNVFMCRYPRWPAYCSSALTHQNFQTIFSSDSTPLNLTPPHPLHPPTHTHQRKVIKPAPCSGAAEPRLCVWAVPTLSDLCQFLSHFTLTL